MDEIAYLCESRIGCRAQGVRDCDQAPPLVQNQVERSLSLAGTGRGGRWRPIKPRPAFRLSSVVAFLEQRLRRVTDIRDHRARQRRKPDGWRFLTLAAGLSLASCALAEDVGVPDQYARNIQARSGVSALTLDVFGEVVNLYNGSLGFTQGDISIPGNNGLEVRFGRKFSTGHDPASLVRTGLGYWEPDIPYIYGVFGQPTSGVVSGWVVEADPPSDSNKRCSYFSRPPAIFVKATSFEADEYWAGNHLYLPGKGSEEMLVRTTGVAIPADGINYPAATTSGVVFRCVALDASSGASGEGFEAVLPDGTVYTFNHAESIYASSLKKPDDTDSSGTSNVGLPRREVRFYVGRVRDRFGNSVVYNWGASGLQSIVASDGRRIDFTVSASDNRLTATVAGKSWVYTHAGDVDSLQLPDGSSWTYRLKDLFYARTRVINMDCDTISDLGSDYTGSISTPSGAVAEYGMSEVTFGRSYVPRACGAVQTGVPGYPIEPYLTRGVAMKSRRVTGPGLPQSGLTWQYAYGAPNNCWKPGNSTTSYACNTSSPMTRSVEIHDPSGAVTRYTYGNRYLVNEGLLVKQEVGVSGSSAAQTTTYEYADPDAAPYGSNHGVSLTAFTDRDFNAKKKPKQKVVTVRSGRAFTWQVASDCGVGPYCFDGFARPTKVIESSAPVP